MVDPDAMAIEFLPEERQLLLEYGYPFDDAKQQLTRYASSRDIEMLTE